MVIGGNVPNLLAEGKRVNHRAHHWHYLERMENYGYKNNYAVLNAREYGIVQARERLYTVRLLGDYPSALASTGSNSPIQRSANTTLARGNWSVMVSSML